MSRSRERAGWLIGLVTAALLAGCGADHGKQMTGAEAATATVRLTEDAQTAVPASREKTSPPPFPTSPPTTALPPPTDVPEPERPADMARSDQAGSVAAARYALSLLPYGTRTNDLSQWDAITHPECAGCMAERAAMVDAYEAGAYDWNDLPEVRQVWVAPPEDGTFQVTFEFEPLPPEDEPDDPSSQVLMVMSFSLRWEEGGWRVHGIHYGGADSIPEWPTDVPSPEHSSGS